MLTVRMEFSFPCKFFHKKIGGIGKMFYLCNTNGIKYTIMATITLDNSTYNDAAMYAKLHNISIAEALKVGMKFLMENFRLQAKDTSNGKYYISPKVKALEMGFKCSKNISIDYKDELSDALTEKYL